jgi:K(+)-stimulated pyrophosphate-energized sodium pump
LRYSFLCSAATKQKSTGSKQFFPQILVEKRFSEKIVELELKQKSTELHAATVVGDTVGDSFKDTSSVTMNPIIKFTTLFGLLAAEIAMTMKSQELKTIIGAVFFLVALVFVHRSFYAMRIPQDQQMKK